MQEGKTKNRSAGNKDHNQYFGSGLDQDSNGYMNPAYNFMFEMLDVLLGGLEVSSVAWKSLIGA
jgi:hypothetical protein